MENKMITHKMITYLIACVWVINGFLCKVLNLVPRHERIVARILGETHAGPLTKLIGIAEILMAIWVICGMRSRLNAVSQILIIATMNTIEFLLAADLLLWGKANAVFALLFIILIYYNEFKLNKRSVLS